jgi:predicted dehydrogenase
MRFARVGDHPDGLAFASAAMQAGHEIAVVCGGEPRKSEAAVVVADLEEVLADPTIEAVIVAGPVGSRLEVARRVLQSERPAAIVMPVDTKPDGVYELSMLAGDTHQAVMPLDAGTTSELPSRPADAWVDLTVTDPDRPFRYVDESGRFAAFRGWSLIRRLVGEVVEVSGFSRAEELDPAEPVFLSGRGENGVFHLRCFRAAGPATLRVDYVSPVGRESHDCGDPGSAWPALVAEFERAVEAVRRSPRADPAAGISVPEGGRVSWRDAIRAAELDDAACRSVIKRRGVLLEYQEASEEVGFKGTMTLVGCALLWAIIMLLMLSAWQPWVGWLILPAILGFLALQALGIYARK